MPRILRDDEEIGIDTLARLQRVKSRDRLRGKDGTEYEVLSVSPALKNGRSIRETSLSLLNLATGKGKNQSVSGWHKDGIYVPTREEEVG
jgi:hypothetical protein